MRKVLLVTPTLSIGGPARRLALLTDALRDECEVCVAVLGADSPLADRLRSARARVVVIEWDNPFNPRPLVELHHLTHGFAPDVVHAWDRSALLALTLSGSRRPGQVFVSNALPPGRYLSWPERWLLRQAGRVVTHGIGAIDRYRRLGVRPERLWTLPQAVEPHRPAPPTPAPGLPAGARIILGVGPVEPHKGFREAVWMFDIVRHAVRDTHLVLLGPGSDRRHVAEFARALQIDHLVHLPGAVEDVAPWLDRAEIVWVPSVRPGGVQVALEAMAAGRPVVAIRFPDLAEVLSDPEGGVLVPVGDKPALARASRRLLQSADLRRQLGEAGRRRADGFSPEQLREAARRLYGAQGA